VDVSRIDVRGSTREPAHAGKASKWGRWTVLIEGGFDESPEPLFAEALDRVKSLISGTKDAESFAMRYLTDDIEGCL
jgi:hypothetical protein